MQVDGSRYWAQRVDGKQHSALMHTLCDRAALFVKKRTRALAYSDDPTGVRSLLSTLFDASGAPAGAMTPVATGVAAPASDLMQMCTMFSSDPFVASFALALCTAGAGLGLHDAQRRSSGIEAAGIELRGHMARSLTECVMHEQAHLLPLRLQMFFAFRAFGAAAVLRAAPQPRTFAALAPPSRAASASPAAVTPAPPSAPRRSSSRLRSGASTSAYAARSIAAAAAAAAETPERSASGGQPPSTPQLGRSVGPSISRERSSASGAVPARASDKTPLPPGELAPRSSPNKALPCSIDVMNAGSWGARAVAAAAGPHMAARHLAVAEAYCGTPLAAAARLGAHGTRQESLLRPDVLAECRSRLNKVRGYARNPVTREPRLLCCAMAEL